MRPIVIATLCFFLVACNAAPVLVRQPTLNSVSLRSFPSKGGVFLLPPRVGYERVENGEAFDGDAEYFAQSGRRAAVLLSRVEKALSEGGIRVIDSKALNPDREDFHGGLLVRLAENHSILASPFKDKTELLPGLQQLQGASGADLACLITLKVKGGRGAGYNPLNGSMSQATSSSSFKVVILSLSTGEILWKNEVYVRKLPTDQVITESIGLLFHEIEDDKRRESK